MNARRFLKQLRKLDLMISNKAAEAQQWRAIATGVTPQYGGERVQSSGSQQKMADAVTKFVEIEAEVNRDIDRLIDVKKDVISVIEQLDAFEYDIMHKVYVQYLTFDQIAEKIDKSYSSIKTAHGRALRKVQEILDERSAE